MILNLGDDTVASEMFEVNRTGLTTTSFSVLVQISGSTNIWILEVRYIAISPNFPHHLNSFDNVPVQYNNGALTNITSGGLSAKTYTNTINYTLQAQSIGSSYTTFSSPLSNNKILLFLTSLYVSGIYDLYGPFYFAHNLYITATPVSTTTYSLVATFGVSSSIARLHFSMIVFDQADVQSSN